MKKYILFLSVVLSSMSYAAGPQAGEICGVASYQCAGSDSHPDCEYNLTDARGAVHWANSPYAKRVVESELNRGQVCLSSAYFEN